MVKGISIKLRCGSLNAQWPGFGSTKTKVAKGQVKSWGTRRGELVKRILAAKLQVVVVQELGQVEAAELFRDLGGVWSYQRFGPLNVVGWRTDTLDFVSTQEIDQWDAGQWPGRGAVVVKLKTKGGKRIRFASDHLGVKTGNDHVTQQKQFQTFLSAVNDDEDDWPCVLGIDSNSRELVTKAGSVRNLARKYGWDVYGGTAIDLVMANYGAKVTGLRRFELGIASDHDGWLFEVTTDKD